jgi:transketolase
MSKTFCSIQDSRRDSFPLSGKLLLEQNTGALGRGLAVAGGIALAGKIDRKYYRVFRLLGHGELAEGSNWEAAMMAAHYRLDNLVAIVDRNILPASLKNFCPTVEHPKNELCTQFASQSKCRSSGWP